jgi:hypothetical protein
MRLVLLEQRYAAQRIQKRCEGEPAMRNTATGSGGAAVERGFEKQGTGALIEVAAPEGNWGNWGSLNY